MASAAVGRFSAQRVPIISLLAANVTSFTGSTFTAVAIPWFVFVTTGSAAKTGITGAVSVLPTVIAGVFGGALVDRIGFKRTSVLSDLSSGIPIALIPILYHTVGLAFWELLFLLFLGRLFSSPGSAARQSLMPTLAGLADMRLERANSANSAAFSVPNLAGPVLAGVLIATMSASNVLFIDAATFGVSALLIGVMVPIGPEAYRPAASGSSYFADLRAGFAQLRQDHLLFYTSLAAALANFAGVALFAVVLPVYAKQVFGSSVDLGFVLAAEGLGALCGLLLYGMFGQRLPKRATFIGAFVIAGSVSMVLATLPGILLVVLILAIAGMAVGPLNPMLQTMLQERVPQDVLGRVTGLVIAVSVAAAPLGVLVAGFLLEYWGLRITILLNTGLLLVVAIVLFLMPALRDME